ncbi:MAG: hypothetical protein AB7W16_21615 [Candidatus Obscuribacterales bacterium]
MTSTDRGSELYHFVSHLSLILERRDEILQIPEYFFCSLSFSWCSWPYLGGDGPLPLGYLIVGWRDGWLKETCPDCGSAVYLICFGGSPLSGSNGWTGICSICQVIKSTRGASPDSFRKRFQSVIDLRRAFPLELFEWQEYDGYEFCWGGSGLRPAKKRRLVRRRTSEPVNLETLIEELSSGKLRRCRPLGVCMLRAEAGLKFSRQR